MRVLIAGCARDCDDVVYRNINALLNLCRNSWFSEVKIFVIENNSKDSTREVISRIAAIDNRVAPIFLEGLDDIMPVRETRLAFCRDVLLDKIAKYSKDGLYVPIDLDSDIASSLQEKSFLDACQLVASGRVSGVFPSSYPRYYDIHALRHRDWCPGSCWKEVQDSYARGSLWRLYVFIRFVSSRQKTYLCLQRNGLIPVDSAFGGVGIYSLTEVFKSGARYMSPDLEQTNLKLCEHVVFNQFFEHLFIDPAWVVSAPVEHIGFAQLPLPQKALRIIRAVLSDMKKILFKLAKNLGPLHVG